IANIEIGLLNSQKALFAAIVNSSSHAILSENLDGIITSWNHGAEKIFGYSANEIIGKSVLTLIPSQLQYEEVDIIKKIRNEEIVNHYETERLRKDGTVFYASITVSLINDFEGNLIGVSKILQDITAQKKGKEEKKRLVERLKLATESAKLGIWELDLIDNTLFWDEEMYELYGIQADEFNAVYEGWISRLHQDDRQFVNHEIQLAISNQKDYQTEFRVIWKDGSVHYIYATGIVQRDAEGHAKCMIGVNRDITSQKEKEAHLKLLESVITNTTDTVLITEAEPFDEPGHRILYVNEAFTKMTGYTAEEVIGKTPRILQGPKSDKNELKRLGETIRKWQPFETTIINYKKNGEEFWINFSLTPVANEKGWYTHWISIEKDVTERKLAELKLFAISKELMDYKFALDQSSIVALMDAKGIIKHVNDNFIDISKYSREEWIGQDYRIIYSDYHNGEFIKDLWQTITKGKIWKGELKNKSKDGTIYWVNATIVPFLDNKGKPYQYIAIRNDITKQKKHQLTIENQNKKLRGIAWTQSHILRAPLARMLGLLNLMELESFKSNDLPEIMNHFKNSLHELDAIITEIVLKTQTLDSSVDDHE
ncbi:MAG: PAS domain S-box protein, partial [Arcicella sp.]|nr:PAS domain S-box protein [Arcicella sp.]